jgi:hypothetical protein
MALTQSFLDKVSTIERRLGMPEGSLLAVMRFETGGTFDPAERNRAGSGATGLIQFMPNTAKALGTSTDALAKMSAEDQLDYVEKYLTPYKGRMKDQKDAYLAVLYPRAIGKPEWYSLFRQDQQPKAYEQNAGLDREKKGMVTVGDALAAVTRRGGTPETMMASRPASQAPAPGRNWGEALGFTAQARPEAEAAPTTTLESTDWAQALFGESAPTQDGGTWKGQDWAALLFG